MDYCALPDFVRPETMPACTSKPFPRAPESANARLVKRYGRGRWRKRKGFVDIKLGSGESVRAELHWYEASGIGKREFKIKRLL